VFWPDDFAHTPAFYRGARLVSRRRRTRERVRGMSEVAKPLSESVGEGVAVLGARLSQRRLVHILVTTHAANRLGREWLNVSPEAVRSSYGRISRKPRASARGGCQSPLDIFIPRLKARVFSLLFTTHVRYRIDRSGTPLCHVFCV
jgi:hypothetical protein